MGMDKSGHCEGRDGNGLYEFLAREGLAGMGEIKRLEELREEIGRIVGWNGVGYPCFHDGTERARKEKGRLCCWQQIS